MSNKKGPEIYKRDENGLIESVEYVFNDDGSVNWRAMINHEHLYPNKDWFAARNQPVPESIEGLDDTQLLIKLSGIKELLKLRGFESVKFNVVESSDDRAVVVCEIAFAPNYEHDSLYDNVTFSSIGNATTNNTNGFGQKFLEPIAENRSFVRCVRNFLNIHIVGADEIDSSKNKVSSTSEESDSVIDVSPQGALKKKFKEKTGKESFDDFLEQLRVIWKEASDNDDKNVLKLIEKAKDWKSYKDIPAATCRKLIKILG